MGVMVSISLVFVASKAMLGMLETLKEGQTPTALAEHTVTFAQFTDQIGLPDIQSLERRYGVHQ